MVDIICQYCSEIKWISVYFGFVQVHRRILKIIYKTDVPIEYILEGMETYHVYVDVHTFVHVGILL